jgi:selenocysteine lyase/cysteine desulfurase
MNSKSTTAFDIERSRADTPGVLEKLHFNNAGASLMPRQVLDAVISHLQLEAQIGGYEAADRETAAIERVYDAVAALINCHRDEVAIVENATRAWDMAFYSMRFQQGDRILTATSEYVSNYIAFLQMQKMTGVNISVVPNDESGQLDISALANSIDKNVRLIAITHVPTNGGLVNPANEVGEIARSAKIPYLLDACQSVGQMPIDVQRIGCDFLTTTGRKFLRGPRATGFLYVRKDMINNLEPPFLDLHAADWVTRDQYVVRPDARRFENWETYCAGKIGLATAIDYALGWGLHTIENRVVMLANRLRDSLAQVSGVTVHDQGHRRCGIVTFTATDATAGEIQQKLARENINVTTSNLAYNRLDMEDRGLTQLVRASVHYYNTDQEIERFCSELHRIIKDNASGLTLYEPMCAG